MITIRDSCSTSIKDREQTRRPRRWARSLTFSPQAWRAVKSHEAGDSGLCCALVVSPQTPPPGAAPRCRDVPSSLRPRRRGGASLGVAAHGWGRALRHSALVRCTRRELLTAPPVSECSSECSCEGWGRHSTLVLDLLRQKLKRLKLKADENPDVFFLTSI